MEDVDVDDWLDEDELPLELPELEEVEEVRLDEEEDEDEVLCKEVDGVDVVLPESAMYPPTARITIMITTATIIAALEMALLKPVPMPTFGLRLHVN